MNQEIKNLLIFTSEISKVTLVMIAILLSLFMPFGILANFIF